MQRLRRSGQSEAERAGHPRGARATVTSIVLHAALFVGLWHVLQFQQAISLLMPEKSAPTTERLRFLTVAPPAEVRVTPPPAPRPQRPTPTSTTPPPPDAPVVTAPPPVTVAPPTQVPTVLPPVSTGSRVLGPTSGPLITGQGAVKGVQPAYAEPRIWIESPAIAAAALEGEAKLDSAVTALIYKYRDSVAANTYEPNKFEKGDWTYTTKDGKKYGIDQQFIRLGKVSIPTALLGLLPMNQQGNPTEYDRQKRLSAMRVEILAQAQQAMNEEEFRRAVKQIRERKERERKEAEKKKKAAETKVISNY